MKISKLFTVLCLMVGTLAWANKPQTVFHNQAVVVLNADQVGRYLQEAQRHNVMKLTRKEPGNISYVAFQSTTDRRLVVFDEIWKSEAALGTHLATPHMQNFFKSIGFDPSLYNIESSGGTTVFTAKPDYTNHVIEKLTLSGFTAEVL